jgi:HTH-type transcriptional regulator/antitoxin HigA
MKLKPIRNEEDYESALQEIDRLWDVEAGTPESDILEILVTLVEAYEKQHYDLPPPEPIAALEYFMESRGWTRKELEPCIDTVERGKDGASDSS